MKTINIKGNPYVMVKDRIKEFHKLYPNGRISTELIEMSDRFIFKATVIPDMENASRYFDGHSVEVVGSTQINKTSALENCETSAIGRALGNLGIGIDESFASADEVANAVYQQNNQQEQQSNKLKIVPDNKFSCPLCGSGIIDQRIQDKNGGLTNPVSPNGKSLPAFKCVKNDSYTNPTCKFASWEVDELDAGVATIESAPTKELDDKDDDVEAKTVGTEDDPLIKDLMASGDEDVKNLFDKG